MVCEFLSPEYKQKLLEIASIDQLIDAGYTRAGAYKVKEKLVLSDEKCEKLVDILGDKARRVLINALKEFASQLNCQVNCEEPEEAEEAEEREEEEEPEEAEEAEEAEEPEEEED